MMTLRTVVMGLLASGAIVGCTPKTADAPAEAPADDVAPAAEEAAAEQPVDQAEPQAPAAEVDDPCNASGYASLIGTNAAAVSLPADLAHRIYKLGDPVTMDFRPDRLNIVTDADGVIIEVKCG